MMAHRLPKSLRRSSAIISQIDIGGHRAVSRACDIQGQRSVKPCTVSRSGLDKQEPRSGPAVATVGYDKGPLRLLSTNAVTTASLERIVDKTLNHSKHRIPQKRASALLNQLRTEAKKEIPIDIPDIKSGDAIEVQMLSHKSSNSVIYARGVVLRKVNKGADSSILIRDLLHDVDIEHNIPLYSPLVKSIRVMERGFIHQGKKRGKRVRQSRIYYIRGLDQKYYRVTGSGL